MAKRPRKNVSNRPATTPSSTKKPPTIDAEALDETSVARDAGASVDANPEHDESDAKDVVLRIDRPGADPLLVQTKYPASGTSAKATAESEPAMMYRAERLEAGTEPDDTETSTVAKQDLRDIADRVSAVPVKQASTFQKVAAVASDLGDKAADAGDAMYQRSRRFLNDRDIHSVRDVGDKIAATQARTGDVADTLRIGLGALFLIGGLWKLSQLLSPAYSEAIVASYTASTGYINEFFMVWLFGTGAMLTPWSFLTMLSAFELVSGLMLLAGLLVRPLALIYGFLLWTFVISLPVVTTNGVDPGVATYQAPAMLVQIRDIALSGMMFALYCLGSGVRSVDRRIFGPQAAESVVSWENVGLLLRLSLALVFIVGGLFAGMANIKSYFEPGIVMLVIGLAVLWGGQVTRYAATAACAVIVFYMITKLGFDKSLLANFNAVKRELAIFAAAFVLAARESGQTWTVVDAYQRLRDGVRSAMLNVDPKGRRDGQALQPAE
ncbi:MAG: DoxX family protein [Pseudomonadota bacterium]